MSDKNRFTNSKDCEQIINQKLSSGQDDDLQAYGFKNSRPKTVATFVAYILSIGTLRLFFHWYPHFHLLATHSKCALSQAEKVLIVDDYQGKYKSYFVKDIKIISTTNLSANILSTSSISIENELIDKLRGKDLNISLENGTKTKVLEYRAFWCKKQCYIWDTTKHEFSKLAGLDAYVTCSDLNNENNEGFTREEQILRRIVYGNNEILVPVQSVGILLIFEILNPFYIFQIFTLGVWLAESYFYFSVGIVCMSIFGIASSILQTRKNQISLRNTVASTETVRLLRRNGEFESISSAELVPGDIIELIPSFHGIISCDAVLLSGTCIVNESMLTGESVPVVKTPLQRLPVLYSSKAFPHHTLFCGTTIIQTKNYDGKRVLAKVIRTGLQTNKGSLVAAILYPPPADFKFDQDSYKFMIILAIIAFAGFLYTIILKSSKKISVANIAKKALDIITIVIPPALPAVMTVGKLFAQSRLKREQIFCINTKAINVSGSINCVCFDKTGTLTEDGLDMMGIVIKHDFNNLLQLEKCVSKLQNHQIFEGMSVCHSLTVIEGKLSGDPLDVKMFESTKWILEEPELDKLKENEIQAMAIIKPPKDEIVTENVNKFSEISIVQQYQFSNTLQRMSVIAQVRGSKGFRAYTKGSPEMILSLSKPESIPRDTTVTLQKYTEQGYRVIAIGYSEINADQTEISSMPREMVENNLEFLGLIILENRLKRSTVEVIKELREANIRTIMITGDNIQTAVSVAKECGILSLEETVINVNIKILENRQDKPDLTFTVQSFSSENKRFSSSIKFSIESIERGLTEHDYKFVMTGNTWQLLRKYYSDDILPKICVKGAVFARMTSDQKRQLIVELMQLGYYVVMCGDGANDCGALRAAHVGISLSEAESSVASPFTSRTPDIRSVKTVIQQGRAALVTSFGIFKFMVNYSLTEFLSTAILYYIDSNVTDFEFLFIDVCLSVNFAFFFGKTEAYMGKLNPTPPMTSLLTFAPLFSLASQMLLICTFQAIAFYVVQLQPWFTPFHMKDDGSYACYENYSVFCVSMFQYITLAVVFSRGEPYRKPIYTNYAFVISLLTMLAICSYITLSPAQWIINLMHLMVPLDFNWRLALLGLAFLNFVIAFCVEYFLVEWLIERIIKVRMYKPKKSKKMYLHVQHDLQYDQNWPPITGSILVLPTSPSVDQMLNSRRKLSMSNC